MWVSPVKRLATALVAIGALGVVTAFVISLVPVWPLSLFEHFRVQYVGVGVLVVAASAAIQLRGWFDAAAIATLAHVLWLAPDLVRARPAVSEGTHVRILLLNVLRSNTHHDQVARLIEDTNADVVALMEVDEPWFRALAPALAAYPARLEHERTDNFGIALYARETLAVRAEYLGTFPSIVGTVTHRDAELGVILTHPIPPVSRALVDVHEGQLAAVAERARQLGPRTVLFGDFNATPWSRPFRRMIAASGLCDTRAGFGLQATFPAASAIMRIPIDHVLVSCAIGVGDRRIERDVGSDHLPVVVDLVVPR